MGQNVNLQFKKQDNRIFFLFLNQIYCFWFPPAWLVGNAVSVVTGASLLPLWRHEFHVVPGPGGGRKRGEGGARRLSWGGRHHDQQTFSSCCCRELVLKLILTLVKNDKENFIQETTAFNKEKWGVIAKKKEGCGGRWKITKRRHQV